MTTPHSSAACRGKEWPHTHHSSPTAPVQPVLRQKRCSSLIGTSKAFRCETHGHVGCTAAALGGVIKTSPSLMAPSHCSALNQEAVRTAWDRTGSAGGHSK